MRGFLGGVSLGALMAVAGAAVISLSVPLPAPVQVGEGTAKPAADPSGGQSLDVTASGQDADLAEAMPAAPETDSSTQQPDVSGAADTAPALRPEAADTAGELADPSDAGDVPQLPLPDATPLQPPVSAPVPSQPGTDSAPVVSADPAAPLPAKEPEPEPEPTEETAGPLDAGPLDKDSPVGETASGTTEDAAGSPAAPVPELPAAEPQQPGVSGAGLPGSAPEPGRLPQVDTPPERRPAPHDAEDETETAALPEEDLSGTVQIGTPVVPFTERDETAGSLPGEAVQSVSPALLSPFEAYSEPFENPEGRPLMSIVLIDDGKSIGAEALEGFPYPLSFAIDPETPDAAEKMAARRAAGFEVLMLANLPREAAPQDAETALPVWLENLPEAIGVLEGTGTGVQGNRALADQVSAVAAAGGLGLVMQNKGLNTVQKLAARNGVPSGVVFRDFDGAGQSPRAIRRFLDQAAFRAGQEGAVIMLGRVRPDTISALLLWGLQDRAGKVALAPVSASMKAALPEG